MSRDLSAFTRNAPLSLSRKIQLGIWYFVQHLIFKSIFTPSLLRPYLLRLFGASIGNSVLIRRGVRVHFPWKLEIGDNCWIGEEVWFINHEKIKVGTNVCISQRSIICSSGHNYRTASLNYLHKPVTITDGAWICIDAKVLPGVTIGECSIVSSGEIARKSLPDYSILIDGQVCSITPPK